MFFEIKMISGVYAGVIIYIYISRNRLRLPNFRETGFQVPTTDSENEHSKAPGQGLQRKE